MKESLFPFFNIESEVKITAYKITRENMFHVRSKMREEDSEVLLYANEL